MKRLLLPLLALLAELADASFRNRLRFHGSAWLMGEPFPPTLCYAADLEAAVSFKDGVFTLSNIQLS